MNFASLTHIPAVADHACVRRTVRALGIEQATANRLLVALARDSLPNRMAATGEADGYAAIFLHSSAQATQEAPMSLHSAYCGNLSHSFLQARQMPSRMAHLEEARETAVEIDKKKTELLGKYLVLQLQSDALRRQGSVIDAGVYVEFGAAMCA
jgi:hypothetical protein